MGIFEDGEWASIGVGLWGLGGAASHFEVCQRILVAKPWKKAIVQGRAGKTLRRALG
jgi:hypothetical protein